MPVPKLNKGDKVTVVSISLFGEAEDQFEIADVTGNSIYLKGHNGVFNNISGRMFDCAPRTKVYIKEFKRK